MKGLFVIHSTNLVYGASKSLAQLLNKIDYEYDIVFPKALSDNTSDEEIRRVYGNKINKIYRLWLPYEMCYVGKEKLNITTKAALKYMIKQIISKFCKFQLNKIVKKGEYDFVYLNSLTLYPLIDTKYRCFMHVREVVDCSTRTFRKMVSKMKKACGVVFIDYVTQNPFKEYLNNELILNNPFNMKELSLINTDEVFQKYNLSKANTIFTVLGTVSKMKGVDLVIKCFIKANILNATLVIVGNSDNEYGDMCKNIAQGKNNIVFIGELKDPSEIYVITDYVIRGDSIFAIGRTVYEGLYSGCNLIIPGDQAYDANKIFEYTEFKDSVYFYTPNNEEALYNVINNQANIKVKTRDFKSNVDNYIKSFDNYIKKCFNMYS